MTKELHWAWWDDIGGHTIRRTVCRRWAAPSEIARKEDDVSCSECKAELARFELTKILDADEKHPF